MGSKAVGAESRGLRLAVAEQPAVAVAFVVRVEGALVGPIDAETLEDAFMFLSIHHFNNYEGTLRFTSGEADKSSRGQLSQFFFLLSKCQKGPK